MDTRLLHALAFQRLQQLMPSSATITSKLSSTTLDSSTKLHPSTSAGDTKATTSPLQAGAKLLHPHPGGATCHVTSAPTSNGLDTAVTSNNNQSNMYTQPGLHKGEIHLYLSLMLHKF